MIFSKRLKLAKAYRKWLKDNPQVVDNAFSVITFLEIKNLLK